MRGAKTRRYYRHWFILRDSLLSWYPSSTVHALLLLRVKLKLTPISKLGALLPRRSHRLVRSFLAVRFKIADPASRHYCTSVETSLNHAQHFRVRTADKTWHLSADSASSRDEWVRTLRRVVFRSQNEGESVKVLSYHFFNPLRTLTQVLGLHADCDPTRDGARH